MTTNNYPVCQVCSKSFKIITSSHLKSHGHTFETYRALFPNAALVDESHKERLRTRNTARKGTKASQETKDKMAASHTGKTLSEATKDAIGAKHKGKTRSEAEIDKWRITYYASIEENGGKGFAVGPRSQEFKDKMSAIASARPESSFKKKLEAMWKARRGSKATPEQRENYRKARLKVMQEQPETVGFIWRDTKPELEFEAELKKRNIPYRKQFHTAQPHYLYDFKVGNMLFEIDGPFHYTQVVHRLPDGLQRQQERDLAKNIAASQLGYTLYRIPVTNRLPVDWIDILRKQGCGLF
jgi:hypothetical protein